MTMGSGIIGSGSIARNSFAPCLVRSGVADLVAVARRDLDKARDFAGDFGDCAAYGSAAELVADDAVDAVIVSTPTDTRCE